MAHGGQADGVTPGPVKSRYGYSPSRGFIVGIAGLVFFAALLLVAGAIGGNKEPGTQAAIALFTPAPTTEDSHGPRETAPSVDSTLTTGPTPAVAGVAVTPFVETPTPVAAPAPVSPAAPGQTVEPTASSTVSPPTPTVGEAVSVTPTVGDAWTSTPAPTAAPITEDLEPASADLAAQIESQYGVRIAREGQDWGDGQAQQLRNLTSVATALQSVPAGVRESIVSNGGGALTFLANHHGRTESGWQPYGDRAANYYTNEDQGPAGNRATNQVVLQPGSTSQTVTHEMMHAFQMRSVAPGAYVEALLTPEMKSFMQTTGWTQLVSDAELQLHANQSWDVINGFFEYNGRSLNYVNEYGSMSVLYTPNPIEAFAEAGGLYYAHSFAMELPDWPDYWDWFSANVG